MDGNEKMNEVIERKNGHKVKYLQAENAQLKALLEDSENNVQINKNMIKVILEGDKKVPAKEKQLLQEMQKETSNLYKQIRELKR